ncbi:hypothetical protein DL93DRAFT_2101084 [Clavulina sp. PMI_390]|nr:hypothetical protein DL93DRAFT_2101084 [Clavulina sp. PMI_390]
MSNVTQVANTNMDAFAGNPPSGVAGVILENSVADLSKGRLATNPKKGRNAFTILIVGERGVGKTSVLNLLYNILVGNGPDNFKPMNDYSNEGQLQGQTETAKAYDFTSKNGVKFLIIDTPGLNDPRGGGYDEIHKGSIAKVITEATTLLNAVLILANGTLARLLLQVQRKVYAQRDPDTAERIQKIIEVLMNEKAILKEVASRKATQKA